MDRDRSLMWPCWWWNWWTRPWSEYILWWNVLLHIALTSQSSIVRFNLCTFPLYDTICYSFLSMDNEMAFWPLAKGAQLLTVRERQILWMAWLMDTEMEAGTGLLWREEGILLVTTKSLSILCKALLSLVEICSLKKSGFISCSWAGLAKDLMRITFPGWHLQIGANDAPTCCHGVVKVYSYPEAVLVNCNDWNNSVENVRFWVVCSPAACRERI